ncbi:hypothetical protein PGB90_005878 [Kerria lacca]
MAETALIDQKTYGTVSLSRNMQNKSTNSDADCNEPINNLIDETERIREHGFTVFTAAIFLAAEMAGSGILALPKAIADSGWIGVILLIIFCLNAAYSGSRLGDCWAILEERYSEFRITTRNPYPSIAFVAVGKWGSYFVSLCIQFTLFGTGTVYLLLASSIIQELLQTMISGINNCIWFLIFATLLCIPMWLGTPKDFWLVGIAALLTTVISCICIFIQIIMDGLNTTTIPASYHTPSSFKDFFLAFGTILFVFGGASTFPTIQNDMINRNDFYKSVRIAFTVILILYLPIAVSSYAVYGEFIKHNIINTLSSSIFTLLAKIFMAIHLILAFLIIINPVSQDLEEMLHISKKFCLKRCIVRTLIMGLMVFIGETIPKFNNILSLIGGSTITLTTFVLPPYFYMKLCDHTDQRKIPLYVRTYMWELILIGIVGGIASSYSAVETIIVDSLSKPCYWPR